MMIWVVDAIARPRVRTIDGNYRQILLTRGATFDNLDKSDPYIARAIALGWIEVDNSVDEEEVI